ncbi:MAG: hypothetical protein LBG71_03000 [Clostridiales Family XIII bacterium]|jgi:biotin carboxyl carrier protein|nr:hypothetical protein [Clostridiales Family XIII bacterium]
MSEVLCNVSGRIKEIRIKAGQMITEDDEVAIIETLKSDRAVCGVAGVVDEIRVSVGDVVRVGDVIAVVL